MAAITDLTWQQLSEKLSTNAIKVDSNGKVVIDVSAVCGDSISGLSNQGVIKFFSLLFTAANKAQIDANTESTEGERLSAFAPATIGTNADGYITLSRPFLCKSELSTATNIIGTNA